MSEILPNLITGYSIITFGFVSSAISLLIIYKLKILHNAFGLICAAQSIVEGSILLLNAFLGYTISVINPDAAKSLIMMVVGMAGPYFRDAVIFLQLLKAINRCVAIIFPFSYKKVFTIKRTIIYLSIIFVLSFLSDLFSIIDACYLIMNPAQLIWKYSSNECTEKFAYLYITWGRVGILGLTLFFDGVTFFYLRMFRKRLLQHTNKKHMNAEIRFFFQTFLTSIFYAIMLLCPRILRPYATTPYLIFISASAPILLYHSTNEFLFIIFTLFINKSIKSTTHIAVKVSPHTNVQKI